MDFVSVFFILFLIFIILIFYAFVFEPYNFKIEKIKLQFKNLPKAFNGLKIVQISDIHSKKFGYKEKSVLSIVKKIKPDFIFITGDIIDYKAKDIKKCEPFFKQLNHLFKNKIFCVFGNHIHRGFFINVHELEKMLNNNNVQVLTNENLKLNFQNDYIYLIGVDDPRTRHHNFQKAIKGVDNNSVKILLSHSSEILEDINDNDVDLILCGHTHGGQVKFPFIRAFWIPTIYHGKYNRGLFNVKSCYMYVNRGIGTDCLPIRFNSAPEITLIELKNKHGD